MTALLEQKGDPTRRRNARSRGGWVRSAIAATAFAAANASAATVGTSFNVRVDLVTADKNVHCERKGDGPSVTVVCVPRNDGGAREMPRYLLQVYRADHWLGSIDAMMATGTVTSWRVVNAANREYVEIVVGW